MSLEYEFRAIDKWPGERCNEQRSAPFRATFSRTLDDLESELMKLDAANVVIQADLDRSQIRIDGMIRAGARPATPGIILSFDTDNGPLSFPADRFDDWHDNLRAIALSLKALRAVDRYGVTRTGEQYTGWAKLPPPNGEDTSLDKALQIIEFRAGYIKGQLFDRHDLWPAAIRQAQRVTHPDSENGRHEAFIEVEKAREVLEAALN